jgi:TonB family protein
MSAHLLTWSVQVMLLTAAGALGALTLANAKARLIFWQGLLLAMLLLPFIESWQSRPIRVVSFPTSTLAPASEALVQPAATLAPQPVVKSKPSWHSEDWFLLIAAGAALRLLWIGAGFLCLRGYRRSAPQLTEPPFRFDSSSARWYVSDTVPGPVTYGWRQPSILLPTRVMQLPSALREAIACHELIHVRRRDWLFVLAEETIRSLLWFHPAVWYVLSRIQLSREQVVDSEVVRLTEDRDGYLDALVEVAAQRLLPDLAPAPLFLRKRHLAARVAAVLKEVSMSKTRIAARLAAVCSAMFFAARVAIWFVPFVSPAQTVVDDPGVTVDAGATLLHRAPVHHPADASGMVTLEANLNAKGEVTDAHVLSGPDDLRKNALASVLQWHYSPGLAHVQISMRFDPVGPALPAPSARRAVIASTPAPAPPVPLPGKRLTRIEFTGFSPEGEQQLRNRLNVHEGDVVSPPDMDGLRQALSEFDSHANAVLSTNSAVDKNPEWVLRISATTSPWPVFRATTTLTLYSGGGYAYAMPSSPAPPAEPVPPMPPLPTGVYQLGDGVFPPVPIFSPEAEYSEQARTAKYQGAVFVSLVVDESGQATNIQVTRTLGLGLDQNAVQALQRWRFKPGMKDGQPVSVAAAIQVNFRLVSDPAQPCPGNLRCYFE